MIPKYKIVFIKQGVGKRIFEGVLPTGVKLWVDCFQNSREFDTMMIEKEVK